MTIPKPVLTFVVGVTGHRSARLGPEHRQRIAQQLADVLRNIEEECRKLLDEQRDLYSASAIPQLVLLSSLADGADAMAVRQCSQAWTIVGLLPAPANEYEAALRNSAPAGNGDVAVEEHVEARERAARVTVLPPPRPQDPKGLVRSRDLLLRQVDVLVAVWDGVSAGAPAGGTADTVDRASDAGIPIIWIAANRQLRPWVIRRVEDVARDTPMADATSGPIADLVRRELAVSRDHGESRAPWRASGHAPDAAQRLSDFLSEPAPPQNNSGTSWSDFLPGIPDQDGLKTRLVQILLPRFLAADALAHHYGKRYRLAYVAAYLLSSLAVAAALASFVLYGGVHHTEVPPGEIRLAALELFVVGVIVAIVWRGQYKRWHDRWLDYRALAETLRHLRFLSPFGQYEKSAHFEAAARPGAGWMLWYFRATMRELGMPSGDLGPDYQRKVLLAIVPAELEMQIKYHTRNLKYLKLVDRSLHWLGNLCFAFAFGILVLFLGALLVTHDLPEWPARLASWAPKITAITAFLPALGAAFAGIRFTGDFDGGAERSAKTGAQLEQLRETYDLAQERLDFDTSAGVVFESARIMAADIGGWSSLYSRKHLTLPG